VFVCSLQPNVTVCFWCVTLFDITKITLFAEVFQVSKLTQKDHRSSLLDLWDSIV